MSVESRSLGACGPNIAYAYRVRWTYPADIKVLVVIDSLAPGGAETSLASMAPGLIAGGVDLHVAYFLERPGVQQHLVDAGASLVSLAGHRSRLGRANAVRVLTRQLKPDLVHTTLFEADVAGRIGARTGGTKVVSSIVNEMYGAEHRSDPNARGVKLRLARELDSSTALMVRRFHAISHTVAEIMAPRLRISRSKVDVVYRGRDPALLGDRNPGRREVVRRRLGIESAAPLALVIGRHEEQKGLDVLIDSVPHVSRRHHGLQVLVAGKEGLATGDLEGRIERLGVGGRVRLLGHRSDVADLLAAADVFVFPSRREGFGGAVIEAMALECPIVCSDLAVLREVTQCCGGSVASLVPPDAAIALADAISDALDNGSAVRERTRDGRALFLERYTVAEVVRGMIGFYQRACDG